MRNPFAGYRLCTFLLLVSMLLTSFPLPAIYAGPVPRGPEEERVPAAPPADPPACPAFNTAHSEQVEMPSLQLALHAAPLYAHVGDPVTVTLALRNDGQLPLEGVTVSMTVPAGLAEVQPSQGAYDPPSGRLTLPLPLLDVSQTLAVTVTARVTGLAMPEGHAILWAEAVGGALLFPARDGALIVVADDLALEQHQRDLPPGGQQLHRGAPGL